KAPATESKDTESNAEAAEKVDASVAPSSAEPLAEEPPAVESAEAAADNPAAEEGVTEPSDTATKNPEGDPAPLAASDESCSEAAAPAEPEPAELVTPEAAPNPVTTAVAAESAPATELTNAEPESPSENPTPSPEADQPTVTEDATETAPTTDAPVAPVENSDATAEPDTASSPEESSEPTTATEDKTADETGTPESAPASPETTSEDAGAPPASPPPLETVREGIVGKDFKKDDTQRVKIQKPDETPSDTKTGLETKDEGPGRNRNSGRKRVPSRSAAQDAVVGAVLFIDDYAVGSLGETPPSPFTKVGGVSLLRRAVLTAREAGLTTLHCLTKPDLRDLATQEVTVKGVDAVFLNSLEEAPFPDEGRVIYIDARALHDIESLKRLQKWRGARVALLCTKLGDGIRVQIEGVRVREIGTDLVPFDACTGGAISIPMELMPRILDEGYQKMLRDMVDEELLGASFTASTTAREVRRESEVDDVRSSLLTNMGLNSDGFMDALIHRRISNHLTRSIYTIDWIKPSAITALACLFGLLAGPLFALAGSVAIAALFATLSLWLSVILDSVDGELARLKQQESQSGRLFDRCAKALVHLSVISGLISWFGYDNLMVLIPGAVFALGQVIAAVVSYAQPPRLTAGHQISWGDRIDGLILNQNYFYLSCPLFIVAAFLERSQGAMVVAGILALSALFIHLSWIGLKVVGTKNRLPN
ncbi:MAG: CDP-alcohol phosphatidyltransferase family protein, partial [Planctomycetota bacterium]|nr:CDP-alcohol phosphatidyltransferase family protein [Planctomycetota bacterium]